MNDKIPVASRFSQSSLAQQLALLAAGLCLLVGLALVTLGSISSLHTQNELQDKYGAALAHLIASRVANAMEQGDLLRVTASLRRFVTISSADEAVVTDIEGKRLGQAGAVKGIESSRYSAPVKIESDIAGEVTISINTDAARAAHNRLILSLLGLTVLLSLTAYAAARHLGQREADKIRALSKTISLEDNQLSEPPQNELLHLQAQVDALPMDLLRTRSEPAPQDENYRTTAVLYLHLGSLARYVDTLDEHALQRYTQRMHQIVYAAAGFYGGELQVVRQFGLAVYFSGENKSGSAAFRAASCAWLVAAVCRELQGQVSLSLRTSMAIAQSELGAGDDGDIYPGLYMQHTLDELQTACQRIADVVMLTPSVLEDMDVASRLRHRPMENMSYVRIEEFAGTYADLLERQLQLIMRRLTDPTLLG